MRIHLGNPAGRSRPALRHLLVAALLCLSGGMPAGAQTAAEFFHSNCAGCHTIGGGRIVGPDLKDVTTRRDADWLARFLRNPKALIDSGDPIATSLAQEARGIVMPTLPTLTPGRIRELVDYLASASKQPTAAAVAPPVDRPFSPEDVAAGRGIFTGVQRLNAGGPACLSCHAVGGLGSLGGGRLGPDLTLVTERLQGRRGLTAWLGAPATSTMQSVFQTTPIRPDEIQSLVAFLDESARTGQPADSVGQLNFLMLGLGGAVFGLVVADAVWRRRFRAVRRPLVEGDHTGVER